jgi:hypothetical protein
MNMKRRNILMGLCGLAGGSGALVGSGAFTSVQAERNVSVAVVDDPDALLGLEGCVGSPNGEYAQIKDNGTMAIDLSPSNDEISGGGEGISSGAETVIRDLFQLKNQGTKEVAVWIDINPVTDGDDPRVVFYLHNEDLDEGENDQIIGYDNRVCLDVGDDVCVSLDIDTTGIGPDFENSEGENNLLEPLEDSDHEMVINAVADECPVEQSPENPTPEPIPGNVHGVEFDDNLYGILVEGLDSETKPEIQVQKIGETGGDASAANYSPNGLAFRDDPPGLYYTANSSENGPSELRLFEGEGSDKSVGTLSATAYGAGWYDGAYYYVANNDGELRKVTFSDGLTDENILDLSEDYGMGDLVINGEGKLYASTTSGEDFFTVDLEADGSNDDSQIDGSWEEPGPENLQLAFDGNDNLIGHDASTGEFYKLDLDNEEIDELGTVKDDSEEILKFTDLANGFSSPAAE